MRPPTPTRPFGSEPPAPQRAQPADAATYGSAIVALVGRPNAGKSTLLNRVLGEELSLATPLPQTTRRNLKGIYTDARMQVIFVDTPGMHAGRHSHNKAMTQQAASVLKPGEVDIVCYLVDLARELGPEEDVVAGLVRGSGIPALIVFNKADACPSPAPRVEAFAARYPFLAAAPRVILSALATTAGVEFLRALGPLVKPGPRLFPEDDLTDENLRFFAAESVRKQIIRRTREEVPHAAFVEIADYRETGGRHLVEATIHVESTGQRGIIVGPKGRLIEEIRRGAEADLAKLAQAPVSMRCHVKVSPHWRDNPAFLREMGYEAR